MVNNARLYPGVVLLADFALWTRIRGYAGSVTPGCVQATPAGVADPRVRATLAVTT